VSKESKELFGLRLKKLRKQNKISQEELAYRVGVSVMTIWRWERGEYGPEFDHLEMIAQALGVRIRDLFDFEESNI
jgi:transcriptional regulator with XRE-family HTH domain